MMPNLIGFSLDYANILLSALGVTPILVYQTISAPFVTPGIVFAQSPAAGQTISGTVTLTIPGALALSGRTVFSQPANLISPIVGP